MNTDMIKAIVELIRDGGSGAAWIASIYYLVSLGRYLVVMGGLWAMTKTVCGLIRYGIDKGV